MVNRVETPLQLHSLSLQEAYQSFGGDCQSQIPWIVRCFENPASPFALSGNITLHDHDCLHILLNRGKTIQDEAFVVGFTMGNASQTTWLDVLIFKVVSRFLYPASYRFDRACLKVFDIGFWYGRRSKVKNLNQLDFTVYYSTSVDDFRRSLGITPQELRDIETNQIIAMSKRL